MVQKAQEKKPWELTNKYLYQICKENFYHKTANEIIAKTLLIGRTYAVALERRKNRELKEMNDNFYTSKVVPNFQKSDLDFHLSKLKAIKTLSIKNLHQPLSVHYYLAEEFKKYITPYKRSFCSKYLHFHLPHLFYIYDSRALIAMRQFIPASSTVNELYPVADKQYNIFFNKCFILTNMIREEYNIQLSTRELDNLFLEVANNM